jgi:hypothetical protein
MPVGHGFVRKYKAKVYASRLRSRDQNKWIVGLKGTRKL